MAVSYKAAVVAKCRECVVDERGPGNWKQQIAACTSRGCPLHPVRPLSESLPTRVLEAMRITPEMLCERARALPETSGR